VGGVLFIVLLFSLWFFCYRRKRFCFRRNKSLQSEKVGLGAAPGSNESNTVQQHVDPKTMAPNVIRRPSEAKVSRDQEDTETQQRAPRARQASTISEDPTIFGRWRSNEEGPLDQDADTQGRQAYSAPSQPFTPRDDGDVLGGEYSDGQGQGRNSARNFSRTGADFQAGHGQGTDDIAPDQFLQAERQRMNSLLRPTFTAQKGQSIPGPPYVEPERPRIGAQARQDSNAGTESSAMARSQSNDSTPREQYRPRKTPPAAGSDESHEVLRAEAAMAEQEERHLSRRRGSAPVEGQPRRKSQVGRESFPISRADVQGR
jgi:hypothetical protein